jgi:hypothetical protein
MIKSYSRTRNAKGAGFIVIIICAFALIALIWGAFQLMLVMGGSREVRNAVDTAVLNVSKHATDLEVPTPAGFDDVANSNGQVSISNISRIWGKAFLINANQQEMLNDQQASNSALANADNAYQATQNTNNALASVLQNKRSFAGYFNSISANSPTKLLGENAVVADSPTESSWATAMMDRGSESNLYYNTRQLPRGTQVNDVQRGGKTYFRGYTAMTANAKDFSFPSFHIGEMPHLVSQTTFSRNLTGPIGATNPVPNAFQESGLVSEGGTSLTASACAQANPQRQWGLAIPHAYMTIIFQNLSKWYLDKDKSGQWQLVKEIGYGTTPGETVWGIHERNLRPPPPAPPPNGIGGKLNGYASLANEYKAANAWMLYTMMPGDHNTPLLKMVQRVQEIDPDFSMAELQTLLESVQMQQGPQSFLRYVIYPNYEGPDCTKPTMKIAPVGGGTLPGWLGVLNAESLTPGMLDGLAKPALLEQPPLRDEPNTCWANVIGGKSPSCQHHTEFSGTVNWTPGTGYGQCLGELKLARITSIYFTSDPG